MFSGSSGQKATRSSGNLYRMDNDIFVALFPELMNICSLSYQEVYRWAQALRVHKGWCPFQRICVETGGRRCSTVAVTLAHFISICSHLPWGITQKEVLPKLQRIVVGLEADPALLEDFRMMHWIPRRESQTVKPVVIDVDANEDENETAEDTFDARQIVSDTAALSAFTKHFNFDGLVFSTLLDEHGGFWVKAKEVAQALGYKAGAVSISQNVDADRHCSL